MTQNPSFKKEIEQLMKIKGETKGSEILSLANLIIQKHGKEALGLVEKEMENLGYPLRFEKIDQIKWYPEAFNVAAMLVAQKLFSWEDLFEIGYASPKFSFGVRLFIKFTSYERVFKESPFIWKKFMDFGELDPVEFNEKEKYCVMRLKGYNFHPSMCRYYEGFLLRISEYAQKAKKITIKETKCLYKGAPYHEYKACWE